MPSDKDPYRQMLEKEASGSDQGGFKGGLNRFVQGFQGKFDPEASKKRQFAAKQELHQLDQEVSDDPTGESSRAAQELIKSLMPNLQTDLSKMSERQLMKWAPQISQVIKMRNDLSMEAAKRVEKEDERKQREEERKSDREFRQSIQLQGLEERRGRTEQKKEESDAKLTEKLSKRYQDSGLDQLEIRLDEIGSILDSLPKDEKTGKPKDIPGYGRGGSLKPTVLTSGVTRKLRGLIGGLSNIQLKQRSGAAVTAPEFARFMQEFGSGKFESEEALLQGLELLRQAKDRDKDTIFAGYTPEVGQTFTERKQGGAPKAPGQGSGLTPEQRQKRIQELRSKIGGR